MIFSIMEVLIPSIAVSSVFNDELFIHKYMSQQTFRFTVSR